MTSQIESWKGYWYTPLYENEQKWEQKTPMETTWSVNVYYSIVMFAHQVHMHQAHMQALKVFSSSVAGSIFDLFTWGFLGSVSWDLGFNLERLSWFDLLLIR